MSNTPRICRPNLTYHLVSRCIEHRNMMKNSIIKDILIRVLLMAQEKYSFQVINYTIMHNHFHFIFRTVEDGETISRIMQFIKSQLARRYNRKVGRTGPFWNERFSDSIIEYSDHPQFYLLWLIVYLAYNPVRSGDVRDPRYYHYCGFNAYVDQKYSGPIKITLHEYFLQLGETFDEQVKKFLWYEECYRKRLALMFL